MRYQLAAVVDDKSMALYTWKQDDAKKWRQKLMLDARRSSSSELWNRTSIVEGDGITARELRDIRKIIGIEVQNIIVVPLIPDGAVV